MTDVPVNTKLNAMHEGEHSRVHNLIAARTKLGVKVVNQFVDLASLWSAKWWGLSESKTFMSLSSTKQRDCVAACNSSILNEAYFIEKSGLAYSAKMVLLAESTDIAQLYALIGADEARHLAWIEPYIDAKARVAPSGQFLAFLSNLIENVPPNLLFYLVQIILEGWGLDHYKRLAQGCQSSALTTVLTAILKDEALHHRSGTLLFDAERLSPDEISLMKEALQTYTAMVQVGPVTVVSCVQQCAGALSLVQIEEILVALQHQSESTRKLALLRQLMTQKGLEPLIFEMEQTGCFKPLSDGDAARQLLQSQN